jgi:hypothetical protein
MSYQTRPPSSSLPGLLPNLAAWYRGDMGVTTSADTIVVTGNTVAAATQTVATTFAPINNHGASLDIHFNAVDVANQIMRSGNAAGDIRTFGGAAVIAGAPILGGSTGDAGLNGAVIALSVVAGFLNITFTPPVGYGGNLDWICTIDVLENPAIPVTVGQWNDSSGSGDAARNAVQTNAALQPLFTQSDPNFNGQPTLATTAVGNQSLVTGVWTVPLVQPFTAFLVGMNTAGVNTWAFDSNAGGECGMNVGPLAANTRIFAGVQGPGGPTTHNVPSSLIGVFSSPNSFLNVSQDTSPAVANIGADGISPLIIGNSQGGGSPGWTIAELAFWTRALTRQEIAELNAYAYVRYGIPIAA